MARTSRPSIDAVNKGYPAKLGYYAFTRVPSDRANTIQVMAMCEAFQEQGVDVTLYACRNPEYPQTTAKELFKLYDVGEHFDARLLRAHKGKWRQRWQCFSRTAFTCGKYQLCYTRSLLAAAACAMRGAPCVLEVHDTLLGKVDSRALAVIKRSRNVKVVAVSGNLADLLAARWDICRERIIVEHNARRPAESASDGSVCSESSQRSGRLRAVYVGSFFPGRGIELTCGLASEHPDVDFVLVGAPDGFTHPIDVQVGDNVEVVPRVPHSEVSGILRSADILLMPYGRVVTTTHAGAGDTSQICSPLKLFEYLAAGRAIVASRLPSIEEVLTDRDNALLAEPENLNEWSERIAELKLDAAFRQELGSRALKASAYYTWARRADRILDAVCG